MERAKIRGLPKDNLFAFIVTLTVSISESIMFIIKGSNIHLIFAVITGFIIIIQGYILYLGVTIKKDI